MHYFLSSSSSKVIATMRKYPIGIQSFREIIVPGGIATQSSKQLATYIYAIELKLDKSDREALDQIFEKEYLHPYRSDPRRKVAVGINVSSEKREIDEYLVKESEQ
jgi:hypothetical protein